MAAPKSAARKPRRKEKKSIAVGQAHIKSTFNNTIVSITDPSGAVVELGIVRAGRLQGLAQVDALRRSARRRVRRASGTGARHEEGRRLRQGPGLGSWNGDPFAPGRGPRGRVDQRRHSAGAQRVPPAEASSRVVFRPQRPDPSPARVGAGVAAMRCIASSSTALNNSTHPAGQPPAAPQVSYGGHFAERNP